MITSENKHKFVTINHILSWTSGQLIKIKNKVIKLYGIKVFIIRLLLMKRDINKVVDNTKNLEVNIALAQENVEEVEKTTIMVKEQGIRIMNTIIYYCIPY